MKAGATSTTNRRQPSRILIATPSLWVIVGLAEIGVAVTVRADLVPEAAVVVGPAVAVVGMVAGHAAEVVAAADPAAEAAAEDTNRQSCW